MQRLIGTFSALLFVVVIASAAAAAEKAVGEPTPTKAILALLAKLETGFNEGDAKGLAACWTEKGEFVGPAGTRADGREGIESQFKEAFAARKEASKLVIHVNDMRIVNEGLALVDAVAEVKPAVATGGAPIASFVLVKQNGRWLIESARERITHLPSPVNHLKDLQWLLGDWSSETSKAGITLRTACDWTANQAFLIRKFKLEGKEALLHGGTEVIGWDPHTNRIRSWVFDADGSFGENIWIQDGNRWLIKYSGTMADGSVASATHILTNVDEATATIQSKDRVVNGTAQPDIPETTLKRQTPTKPAAKAEETTKTAEKAVP